MSLTDKLALEPQREKAGSTAHDRFEFQTHWGVGQLIELHDAGKDYAIGFEFHDDILVLDSFSTPQKIKFFQVKTKKTGNWTISQLTKHDSKKPSIAAKMYTNKVKFPDETDGLELVSNQTCNFLDSEKLPCSFGEADKKDFDKFVEKLKHEVPSFTEQDAKLFSFQKCKMPLDGYENFIKGRLVDFVQRHLGDIQYNPSSFYAAVTDQCRSRSKNMDDVKSFAELCKAKFITPSDVSGWLAQLRNNSQGRVEWHDVAPSLNGWGATKIRNIAIGWREYDIERLDRSNVPLAYTRDYARSRLEDPSLDDSLTLVELIDELIDPIMSYATEVGLVREKAFLVALLFYEYHAP